MSKQDAFAGLVYAADLAAASRAPSESKVAAKSKSKSEGDERSILQAQLGCAIEDGVAAGKIVLAEGGTGLGKSRVIVNQARRWFGSGATDHDAPGRVLVVAPTIAVIGRLLDEWRQTGAESDPQVGVILGRPQFVDRERFAELLICTPVAEQEPAADWTAARKWMDEGCPAKSAIGNLVAELTRTEAGGLAEDLMAVAPDFPVREVVLDAESSKDAATAYYELRAAAESAQVIFTSHTALCLDVMLRMREHAPLLPAAGLLLVDEAHQLEEAMAAAVGGDISMLALRAVLRGLVNAGGRGTKAAAAALECAESLMAFLMGATKEQDWLVRISRDEGKPSDRRWDEEARPLLTQLADLLGKLTKTTEKREGLSETDRGRLKSWANYARRIASGDLTVRVTYSPVRRVPTLVAGPLMLRSQFEALWKAYYAAALLSATLFVDTKAGWSAGYVRMKLHIPPERFATPAPAHPKWNYTTPTLFLPKPESQALLRFPTPQERDRDPAAESVWADHVALGIRSATVGAIGGTLVLCTSFADVAAFTARLAAGDQADRILEQGRSGISALRSEFMRRARAGERPIWIATGAAWTGLDLRDDQATSPKDDVVLTDLVITRLPFGLNQTSTHLARMEFLGMDADMLETAIRLRQGLGRLIRCEGLLHRRLWFLDGRISGPKGLYYARIVRVLERYPINARFVLPD